MRFLLVFAAFSGIFKELWSFCHAVLLLHHIVQSRHQKKRKNQVYSTAKNKKNSEFSSFTDLKH
jgi:hypothetical protein